MMHTNILLSPSTAARLGLRVVPAPAHHHHRETRPTLSARPTRSPWMARATGADTSGPEDRGSAEAAERRRQERLQARQARQAEAAKAAAAAAAEDAAAADGGEAAAAAAAVAAAPSSSAASRARSGGGRLRRAAAVAARRRSGAGGSGGGGAGQLLAARLDVPDDDDDDDDEEEEERRPVAPPKKSSKAAKPSDNNKGRRAGGKSEASGSQPQAAKPQQQQQKAKPRAEQQQQQQQRPTPVFLDESSPFYQPALTDDDLGNDPPGHRSGYVAVIGRPNAGKSTLINALVGQKLCAVSPRPQTTRHRVVGLACGPDHQMVLFDTPGIVKEQRSRLEERMMAAVVSSIRSAEAIVAVVDAADDPREALAMFQPGPDWDGPPMAVLLNKADVLLAAAAGGKSSDDAADSDASDEQPRPPRPRAGEGGGGWGDEGDEADADAAPASTPVDPPTAEAARARLADLEAWYREHCRAEAVFVGSARRGAKDAGVAAVRAWAVGRLPEGPTLYPKAMVSDQPERFFVAEIIREAIFAQYGQEIPYAAQVQVEEFRERRQSGGGGGGGRKLWEAEAEGGESGGTAAAAAAAEEGAQQEAGGEKVEEKEEDGKKSTTPSTNTTKDYIAAAIVLERESQVAIVVGAGGKKLRRLGAEARREIEGFLGRPVYLDLTVRAAPAWRDSPERLREFGYYSDLYM